MEARIPAMQPIRFYKPGSTPDWLNIFPNMDNIIHREKWIEGFWNTQYYSDWILNKEMIIQLRISVTGDEDLTIYQYDESAEAYIVYDTITPTNITPVGWVSEQVNRYAYTFTEAGTYYIDSSSAGYRSDKFVVHQDVKYRRKLVQIEYYNTFNDYGMIFFDGLTPKYTGAAYFTGGLMPDTPGNEISAFETDRGDILKQRSTPLNSAILKITDIHYAEISRVNLILACDRLTINGISYQNNEPPEVEQIAGTDLVNITVKIRQTDFNYFIS